MRWERSFEFNITGGSYDIAGVGCNYAPDGS